MQNLSFYSNSDMVAYAHWFEEGAATVSGLDGSRQWQIKAAGAYDVFLYPGELHDTQKTGTEPCEYMVFEFPRDPPLKW